MHPRYRPTFLWLMFEGSTLGAGEVNSQLLRLPMGIRVAPTLQSLRLLAEDAQLEIKRSNEGDPSQSGTSEALRARRANDSGPLFLAG
jgi:hypothetical protein